MDAFTLQLVAPWWRHPFHYSRLVLTPKVDESQVRLCLSIASFGHGIVTGERFALCRGMKFWRSIELPGTTSLSYWPWDWWAKILIYP